MRGIIVGAVLAGIAANLLIQARTVAQEDTVNRWTTPPVPAGILLKAACPKFIAAANGPKRRWTL